MDDMLTTEDILIHYKNRMTEISDRAENIRKKLYNAQSAAQSGWKGMAGNAAQSKLSDISGRMAGISSDISDIMQLLSGIGTEIENEES